MKALVIGGTGPTGPYVVKGLQQRGYEVAILHRGTHDENLPSELWEVEHIHADPHFTETLQQALGQRQFDLVVAMYGRQSVTAPVMKGRTPRLIAVGGPNFLGWMDGLGVPPFPTSEDAPICTDAETAPFGVLMTKACQAIMDGHRHGWYSASYLRYPPRVYGPRQLGPSEWSILRRLLDGRRQIIVADNGLQLLTRCYSENAAHYVLLCVDHPKESAGEIYNVTNNRTFSIREWVELIARFAGFEVELVSLPAAAAAPAWPYYNGTIGRGANRRAVNYHRVYDNTKARTQLGYTDVVPAEEGLKRAVEWLADNRPAPGGEIEQRLEDAFNYEAEDMLIRTYQGKCLPALEEAVSSVPEYRDYFHIHGHAHPKQPGMPRDHRGR